MKGILVLEDGTVVEGRPFGARATALGELVFNTNMTGYCEALTDPSYRGQILMMTYPLVGNYGVDPSTFESSEVQVRAFVVHDLCREPQHPRSTMGVDAWLRGEGIPGLEGIDTRALTLRIRERGTLRAAVSTDGTDSQELLETVKGMDFPDRGNLVAEVSCTRPISHAGDGPLRFPLVDCGVKGSIIRLARQHGEVLQVPYDFTAEAIRRWDPDGIVLSNGPGDPAHPAMMATTVRSLAEVAADYPILGICLGHQLLALAFGGATSKLKFGHRGGNHPVKQLSTGRVAITSQNHGFSIAQVPGEFKATHVSLNDGTTEGMEHRELPILSRQYHPEGAPGPHDSRFLFAHFAALCRGRQGGGGAA